MLERPSKGMFTQKQSPMPRAPTALAICVMVVGSIQLAAAQGTTSDPEAERKADLVTAYKILVNENILDSFGHVSSVRRQIRTYS